MSWLATILGKSRESYKTCAICGVTVVEGLLEQVYNWVVDARDDQGRPYGGFCRKCGKYYCWRCARRRGEHLLGALSHPVLASRGTFGSATILDYHGMMYCPRCGDLRTSRTLQAT